MMHNGELQLIEQLFRQYYKVLRIYALRLVGDRDVAEDIVQDVFVALCDDSICLDARRNVKSYLFKAVHNRALNYLSSKQYTEEESLEQIVDQISVRWVQESNQHNMVIANELQEEIRHFAATKLPPQVQRVFMLSRAEGMRIPEIASEMNLSHKTVEKYLTRALADLRLFLKGRGLMMVLLLLFFYLFS